MIQEETSMSRSFFLLLTVSALAVLSPQAYAQYAPVPPDYSPRYVRVPVYSTARPDRIAGYQLVPESCLTPDPTDTELGSRLPPGCANDANLLGMIESKRDLVQGRKLGPAPALPSARAAQKYLYGTAGLPPLNGAGGHPGSQQPSSQPTSPDPTSSETATASAGR
jgi:hypothetical protein